jgi:hypothetical protein
MKSIHTHNLFTLNPDTEALIDRLLEAKFAPNKSALVRDAIKFYSIRFQIEALLADFVQMNDPHTYQSFFIQIKELMKNV